MEKNKFHTMVNRLFGEKMIYSKKKSNDELLKLFLQKNPEYRLEDIAVIGMACRFPGANSYAEYWRNLENGVNSIQEITSDRWDVEKYYSPNFDEPNKSISKWGGLLDDIKGFDNKFFKISPREAENMDPQQRILLEESWHCLEDAGVPLKHLQKYKTSIYVGVMAIDYHEKLNSINNPVESYAALGNYEGILANRVSFVMGLTGTSESIDAACASSLVAIDQARKSLTTGESQYVLAGGVNVICHPWKYISFSKSRMLSPDGQCKTFDSEANGYVPGEGIGILLLTTLKRALLSGHRIHAVIKGSAVNHTGKGRSITAPKVSAQREVITKAIRCADIPPGKISYIEAHGTGTSLGDPVEVEALKQAFPISKEQYCAIGSVKTNIGHLEAASGAAGIIKVILMMKHNQFVPTLNVKTVNPLIDFSKTPFKLSTLAPWNHIESEPRYAGISSFGFGGVNSHVVLADPPQMPLKIPDNFQKTYPFILSARTVSSLEKLLNSWKDFTKTEDFKNAFLRDISYTLCQGRKSLNERFAVFAKNHEELSDKLDSFFLKKSQPERNSSIFVLGGIDSINEKQFNDLFLSYPSTKRYARECDAILMKLMSKSEARRWRDRKFVTLDQPILKFIYLYAIGKFFLKNTKKISSIAGEKEGHLVSAVLSGWITLSLGLRLLWDNPAKEYDKNFFHTSSIKMYDPFFKKEILPLSFHPERIDQIFIQNKFLSENYKKQLKILYEKSVILSEYQHTFIHYLQEWEKACESEGLSWKKCFRKDSEHPTLLFVILLISLRRLYEKWGITQAIIPKFEWENVVEMMLHDDFSYQKLIQIYLNSMHKGSQLSATPFSLDQQKLWKNSLGKVSIPTQFLENKDPIVIGKISASLLLDMKLEDFTKSSLLNFSILLWERNYLITLTTARFPKGNVICLPNYPFEKTRHWIESEETTTELMGGGKRLHPLIQSNVSDLSEQCFEQVVGPNDFYLKDHNMANRMLLPGVAYLEMARAAGNLSQKNKTVTGLEQVVWLQPLEVKDEARTVVISLYPEEDQVVFSIRDKGDTEAEQKVYAEGVLSFASLPQATLMESRNSIESRCTQKIDHDTLYAKLTIQKACYGESFQAVEWVKVGDKEAVGKLVLPKIGALAQDRNEYVLHPSLLDGAVQCIFGFMFSEAKSQLQVPFSVEKVELHSPLPNTCYVLVKTLKQEANFGSYDLQVLDEAGHLCMALKGFNVRALGVPSEAMMQLDFYTSEWKPMALEAMPNTNVKTLILFANETPLTTALIAEFQQQQRTVVHISPGESYRALDKTHYQVRPGDSADYHALFKTLHQQSPEIGWEFIVDLWQTEETVALGPGHLLSLTQVLLEHKIPKTRLLHVYCERKQHLDRAAMNAGFMKTLKLEHPQYDYQLLSVSKTDFTQERLGKIISDELTNGVLDIEIHYEGQERSVKRLEAITFEEKLRKDPLKKGGVYLITGGLGGLGLIFARYLKTHYDAKLVLTGRSALDEKRQKLFDELGENVLYVPGNISQRNDVEKILKASKDRFGHLNGILHAAGILKDAFILKKTPEVLHEVLAPKVQGTLLLDELTQHESLDVFILFSSIAGVIGNVGQCDYAMGNAFMNTFASYRNELQKAGKRFGQTFSIAWPLWAEGGMQVDENTQTLLRHQLGLGLLETETGLSAFQKILTHSTFDTVMPVFGVSEKMHAVFTCIRTQKFAVKEERSAHADTDALQTAVTQNLKTFITDILKIPSDAVDVEENLSNYGFDSISFTEFANQVNAAYALTLTPPIFFEHPTIDSFTSHLLNEYYAALVKAHPSSTTVSVVSSEEETLPKAVLPKIPTRFSSRGVKVLQRREKNEAMDIAIIGMSGVFPGSPNLESFWRHLEKGDDLVRGIPSDREALNNVKGIAPWGGFIDDIDKFDAAFFTISPREAELMDPQHRLFLQAVCGAIEDAGYALSDFKGSQTSLFVGVFSQDYYELLTKASVNVAHTATGTTHSVLCNRVSYWLGLRGTSEAIDTACSSSLVAVHRAVQSLQLGESETAIAGGVNALLTPALFESFTDAGMLSPDGRCKTFDKKANGYVRGEGVGVIVLKPLLKAQADGDTIHAVIKGTAVNHGGHVTTLTAPNPTAQAELIKIACENAKITPDTISYIETHGTGTSLGDPIEINGLKKAFSELAKEQHVTLPEHTCALGTVKTNIGHLETAAGIAGMIKTVLAMRQQKIPKILHFEELNPYIDLKESPFYIATETIPWKPNGAVRRAGISSFGFGGSNAHVIVEEYPKQEILDAQKPYYLVTLSAKTENALREREKDLLTWLENPEHKSLPLSAISYTLNLGRSHYDYRAAMVVKDKPTLVEALRSLLENKLNDNIFSEKWDKKKKSNDEAIYNEVIRSLYERLKQGINNQKLYQETLLALANLYVKGYTLDWSLLHQDEPQQRISLPTYPFAKSRYWVDTKALAKSVGTKQYLHPLLHENTSNLAEERFSSTFTGDEFFLKDHQVQGQKILPGVAYLEMARAAVHYALSNGEMPAGIRLKNVVWASPFIVKAEPKMLQIRLFPEENGEISYEISTPSLSSEEEIEVHSQGVASLESLDSESVLDLSALQQKINQSEWSAEQCYEAFETMGLHYGPGQQGLEKLWVKDSEVLAKLTLPVSVLGTEADYVLHPSLLDAALQASIGLILGSEASALQKPALPFALEAIEIIRPCEQNLWAWIRPSTSETASGIQKLDIDVCNEAQKIVVRLKGFSSRIFEPSLKSTGLPMGALLVTPRWKAKVLGTHRASSSVGQHHILLCGFEDHATALKAALPASLLLDIYAEKKSLPKRFQRTAMQLFESIQTFRNAKPKENILIQVVIPTTGENTVFAGLSGLLKTAHHENPKIQGQVIELSEETNAEDLLQILEANRHSLEDERIRYEDEQRFVLQWEEISPAETVPTLPWKENGVYLITGGAGGLGLIFAREILQHTPSAKLILTGRSALSEEKETELNSISATIQYQSVDVSDHEALKNLISKIQSEQGTLSGMIHSAGVIRDNFILRKTKEEFRAVLQPKVAGTVYLDELTKDLPLDFFILFSSMAGALGNVGQADYATGNAFMDAYASYRNEKVTQKERQGQTLSLQWPLWKEGGMSVDATAVELMKTHFGLVPLESAKGIHALYQAWTSGQTPVMVLDGKHTRIKQKLQLLLTDKTKIQDDKIELEEELNFENQSTVESARKTLEEKTLHQLKVIFEETLKLTEAQIDAEERWEAYGIDSIMMSQLNQKLSNIFTEIPKTLFFEYSTLKELSHYFIGNYKKTCEKWVGFKGDRTSSKPASPKPVISKAKMGSRYQLINKFDQSKTQEPIAIIGISGHYPQAETLSSYWENLKAGKDCITEIPSDRWPLEGFFNPNREEAIAQGKSYSKWGGFLEGFSNFDCLFFNISPREAMNIDPQERLFLQTCWELLEDAGYTKDRLFSEYHGRVGVFAGITKTGFDLYGPLLWHQVDPIYPYTSFSSVANRISYFLNLHGPSYPIDTMCSSSLTAIHEACEHLRHGACEIAIAGGVNLYLHPSTYVALCMQRMLSTDGQCKSFGIEGNGFVPGEGVGAVLLKSLSRAIRDNDHIYAVIRGSGVNHGGKTQGYTVPNPKAQGDLIRATLDKAGINARWVSYVEAHGTGTELGDPIEVRGLSFAFEKDTTEKGYCALGSVKSNMGHLEAAAGIAGITKIILQMQHKQLVSSLHSEILNPNIDFTKTPFIVNQELREWSAPVIEGKTYPRIAGLSSFGAGGSNAHIILEEYVPEVHAEISVAPDHPALIVLSAKNRERLQEYAKKFLEFIQKDSSTINLTDMAYTLQVGREAMEERLGMIVNSIEEFSEKLQAYVDGKENIEDLYRGQVKREKETFAVLAKDDDMEKAIDAWMNKGKYLKLLELWVKGLVFDWDKLYGEIKPHRISLPTYPFIRDHYWIDTKALTKSVGTRQYLHPLLHENTSSLAGERFRSIFTGDEFFLKDHQVQGQKVLPGVAYLEMARVAVHYALSDGEASEGIRLRNVVWASPFIVKAKPKTLQIRLFPKENGEISYEISTPSLSPEEKVEVHSQGVVSLKPFDREAQLDLSALQQRSHQTEWSAQQCYEAFENMGLHYGPGHQGLEKLWVKDSEVLAKLSLPASVLGTEAEYVLHPSLLDAALQASIGLILGSEASALQKPAVPFALEVIEIIRPCETTLWAWVRPSAGETSSGIQKVDIDLCNAQGEVCVSIHGFSTRYISELESKSRLVQTPEIEQGTLILAPEGEVASSSVPKQKIDVEKLPQRIQDELVNLMAETLKLNSASLDVESEFSVYGVDSILLTHFTNEINAAYGLELNPANFFEHSTLQSAANYLAREYGTAFAIQLGIDLTTSMAEKESIEPMEFSLSKRQIALWVLQERNPEMIIYNVPIALQIKEKIDVNLLKQAGQYVAGRHSQLQVIINETEQGVRQFIKTNFALYFEHQILGSISKNEVQNILKKTFKKPFILSQGPLFRMHLFSLSEVDHILLFNIHHIIFDGASTSVLLDDFFSAYNAFSRDEKPILKPLETFYSDFVSWEEDMQLSQVGLQHLDYWKKELAGELSILDLPIDKPRPARQTYQREDYHFVISGELKQQIQQLAKDKNVTLFMLLLGIYKILLSRYTNQEDIIVGIPVSGRVDRRFNSVIGLFVNIIPLRSSLEGSQTFIQYLQKLKGVVVQGLKHSDYPFSQLVSSLKLETSSLHSLVFQTSFTMQNIFSKNFEDESVVKLGNFKIMPEIRQTGTFDFEVEVIEQKETLAIKLSYNPDLFYKETIADFVKYYSILAKQIVEDPTKEIAEYQFLDAKDKKKILMTWNATDKIYPHDKTIYELFQEQVKKTPRNIALIFKDKQLTYKELNEKSNQLARYIHKIYREETKAALQPDTLIALCLERSLAMIIAILAIFKIGAAYVPIDPTYPAERISYMLQDTKAKLILTQLSLKENLISLTKIRQIILDNEDDMLAIKRESAANLKQYSKSKDLAYVIYTSGTSGKPKGVMIEHRSVVNYIVNVTSFLSEAKNIDFSSNFSFDLSVTTSIAPLLIGKTVCLYSGDPSNVHDYISHLNSNKIDFVSSTPSYLCSVPFEEYSQKLKICFLGGEKTDDHHLKYLHQYAEKIYDEYGPTETAVAATIYLCDDGRLSIGKPYNNYKVYVLDKSLNPVPIGVVGELFIGGAGVARGYWNQTNLTEQAFIPNPFATKSDIEKGYTRLYKTGDLVCWLRDGNLKYVGRNDFQAKIRGYRIELGEIETVLSNIPEIDQVAIVAREKESGVSSTQYLVSYYTTKTGKSIDVEMLINQVGQHLPQYMIPSAFVHLDKLPLTISGKLDSKELPDPDFQDVKNYIAPSTELEVKLCEIWKSILGLEKIGINDDFFRIGGDSILSIQLISQLRREELPCSIKDIFELRTVNNLARHILSSATKSDATQSERKNIYLMNDKILDSKIYKLFMIHPGGGDIWCYAELASQLNQKIELHAVRPQRNSTILSLEQLASQYLHEIRTIQPNGPYYLGGWSFGGCVAYEIAHQLLQIGEQVNLLIIIDSWIVNETQKKLSLIDYNHILDIETYFTALKAIDKVTKEQIKDDLSFDFNLLKNYREKIYDAPVLFFKAEKVNHLLTDSKSNFWRSLYGPNFHYHGLHCDHFSITRLPYIITISDEIIKLILSDEK